MFQSELISHSQKWSAPCGASRATVPGRLPAPLVAGRACGDLKLHSFGRAILQGHLNLGLVPLGGLHEGHPVRARPRTR